MIYLRGEINLFIDICTPYKSSNDTDVPLSDRINYYYNNDETQCQAGCLFSTYNIEVQKLKCECSVSSTEMDIGNKNNKKESAKSLFTSFYDVLKYSNYKVLKCFNLAFNANIFSNNIGSILTLVYFAIYFIFLIFFYIKGITELKSTFSQFAKNKKSKEIIDELYPVPIIINKNSINSINNKNNIPKIKNENLSNNLKTKNDDNNKNIKRLVLRKDVKNKKYTQNNNIYQFPPKKFSIKSDIVESNKNKDKNKLNNNDSKRKLSYSMREEKELNDFNLSDSEIKKEEKGEKFDNYELNNMEYELAIKNDKRKFIEIYWSILKREHIIIFSFLAKNDHNILAIKFSRLIFSICTDMALNVFFFSDDTMHKMFLDYGKYNFFQQIPQILYSTIVSQLIDIILCYLSLTDKYYYYLKKLPFLKISDLSRISKIIKIKITFFYVFTFVLFLFYCYIISCFCAVYQNTQTAFIKDSILSFVLGLLYPFVLYLFPAFLRIISLKYCLFKLSLIYKLSDLIPFF